MALRRLSKVFGICIAVAAIGVAAMRYLAPCEYECDATEFADDPGQWFSVGVRGAHFELSDCYYDFCPGGGEGTIDSGGRLHQVVDEADPHAWTLQPMRIERAPDGRPLALSYGDGSGKRSALECKANHWWVPDTAARGFYEEVLGGPHSRLVLAGLVLGLPLSVIEARRASRSSRGRRFALKALLLRLVMPFGLLALANGWIAFRHPSVIPQLSLWPSNFVRAGVCALALGQLLAAGLISHRREDNPKGSLSGAPSVGTLLVITAAYGSALAFIPSPVMYPDAVRIASVMLPLWGLLYLSAPRLLWLALPHGLRQRVQQAGLALLLFAFGQAAVASDSARHLLNVFVGVDGFDFSNEQIRALRLPGILLAVIALGGAIAVVTLELVALRRRAPAALRNAEE